MKKIILTLVVLSLVFICVVNLDNCRKNIRIVSNKYNTIDESIYLNSKTINELNASPSVEIALDSKIGIDSDIINKWRYITLETKDHPIGVIDKMLASDSLLFVLSVNNTKSLTAYNISDGKFFANYGRVGRSRQEYVEPTDFLLLGKNVIVLDNISKKLLFYDINGKYIKTVSFKYSILSIATSINNSSIYAVSGDNRHIESVENNLILEINPDSGDIISSRIDSYNRLSFSQLNSVQNSNGNVVVYEPFVSRLIQLADSDNIQIYSFSFDSNELPNNYLEKCKGDYSVFIDKYRDKYSYINKIYDLKDHLLIRYTSSGARGYMGMYDKRVNKLIYDALPSISSNDLNIESVLLISMSNSAVCDLDGKIAVEISDAFAMLLQMQNIIEYNDEPIIAIVDFKK